MGARGGAEDQAPPELFLVSPEVGCTKGCQLSDPYHARLNPHHARYFHRHQPLQLQACQLVRLLAAAPGTSGPLVEKGMVGYLLAAMQNISTVKIQALPYP